MPVSYKSHKEKLSKHTKKKSNHVDFDNEVYHDIDKGKKHNKRNLKKLREEKYSW